MKHSILSAFIAPCLVATLALAQETGKPRPAAQPRSDLPDPPLEGSEIVVKPPRGGLALGQKNGKGMDGVKLSQHDLEIGSPSVAVGPDGSIHAAFVEKHTTTHAYAAYHRSSSDGGQTWTEAKNLVGGSTSTPALRFLRF